MPRDQETVRRDVGRRIRELRSDRGWTQARLAEKLGMPVENLARLEQGKHSPTVSTLVRVALALKKDVSLLFSEPASREPIRRGRPRKASDSPESATTTTRG